MASVNATMSAARRKLPIIPTTAIIAELAALQRKIADDAVTKLKVYPPELQNQHYVRTFRLQHSWRIIGPRFSPSSGVTTSVVNSAIDRNGRRYASLVQGKDQKQIHMGRWLRVDEAMQHDRLAYRAGIKAVLVANGLT